MIGMVGGVALLFAAVPCPGFAAEPVGNEQDKRQRESAKAAAREEGRAVQREALRTKLRNLMKMRRYQQDPDSDSSIEGVKTQLRRLR